MATNPDKTNKTTRVDSNQLPAEGYVRLKQILGDKKKQIPPIFPIGKTAWHAGILAGKYPKPYKVGRTALYKVEEIRALLEKIEQGELV